MNFKDYFSKQASEYTRYRPHYPEALFEYLATLVSSRQRVWGRPEDEKEIHWPINMRVGKLAIALQIYASLQWAAGSRQ